VIVDYVGIFANLQDALAIYATPQVGGDKPTRDKAALVDQLEEALAEVETFCTSLGVDLSGILAADKLLRAKRIGDAQEILISPDERRRDFLRRADAAIRAYKALLPDERAAPFLTRVAALAVVAEAIRNRLGPPDISAIADQIERLLDANIMGIEITAPIHEGDDADGLTDLSAIDFEKLAAAFATKPRTTAEQLRTRAMKKVQEMAARNPTRVDLVERLEKLIDAYNTASIGVEELFERLKQFIQDLAADEARAAREGLTEDELAIFDLLTKPEPKLTKAQEIEVKKVARELLEKLQEAVSVFQWRQRQQTRATVRSKIEVILNNLPEAPYPEELWHQKVEATWSFVLARYGAIRNGRAYTTLSDANLSRDDRCDLEVIPQNALQTAAHR
jgi:type I restriction enzyme R subunit